MLLVADEKRRELVLDGDSSDARVNQVRAAVVPDTGVQAKEVWLVDKTESATRAQRVNRGEL